MHPAGITSPLWGGRKSEAFSGGGMRKRLKAGVIERARRLRGDRPDTERLLWWKLRELNAHGYHFRRQVPLRGSTLPSIAAVSPSNLTAVSMGYARIWHMTRNATGR
jgi:hypothetical protein